MADLQARVEYIEQELAPVDMAKAINKSLPLLFWFGADLFAALLDRRLHQNLSPMHGNSWMPCHNDAVTCQKSWHGQCR